MATQQAGLVLRHLRSVLTRHQASGQTDRELLRRFARMRDDEAFAELVRRHGAMVRAVCGRVLPNPADADDVFQAAFLVLARKAKAGGWRDSIANWLYTVAYRLAMRVRDDQRRRAAQEARAGFRAPSDPLAEVSCREMCAIVDEELNRLPKTLRAGLLLCCLEGKTRDEAARALGWTLGTLKLRLERGRALLRARLQKRGFTLPAVLAGVLVAEGVGNAVVPKSLARTTLQGAMLTTPAAASFPLTKFALVFLLTISLAAAGYRLSVLSHPPEANSPRATDKPKSGSPQPEVTTLNPERVSLTGNVLDAQGKPVAGAVVLLSECPVSWSSSEIPGHSKMQPTKTRTLGRTATDGDGRFSFKDVPVDEPERSRGTSFPFDIVVAARGHALAWKHWLEPSAAQPMRFVLPTEKLLRGRVTDPHGKPVKAAHVQVVQIARVDQLEPPDLTHADCVYLHHTALRPVAETDEDGSFAIPGLPSDVRVTLRVSHDRFVLREVYAATTQQQLPAVLSNPRSGVHSDKLPQPILTGDVAIRLESAGRLVGRVVYADTGKPVPRAGVGLYHWPAEYTANDEGRFAIGELPPGEHHFRIYPPKDSEYLGVNKAIKVSAGGEIVRDFKLPRGNPVTGRVLDEETGKGVAGVGIIYIAEKTAPADQQLLTVRVETGPDGRFRIAVPPGKGELFISIVPQNYAELDVETGRSITEAGPRFRRAVDVATGKGLPDVEFQVTQGVRIMGRVLDPAGKPAAGVSIETRQWMSANSARDLARLSDMDGAFRFGGLREQECELIVRDRRRKLGARIVATPHKDKSKQLEVHLRPMVAVTGCVRDDDGNPVADACVRLWSYDGKMGTATPYIAHTDAQGLFTLNMLVSGARYGIQVGAKGYCGVYSREFALKPGDPHTLADLTLRKANESLAGVLVSKTGTPLAGVIVRGCTFGCESEARVTDALGRFQLTGLPRGRIQIDAWLPWIKDGSFTQAAEAGNQNARVELPVEDKRD